MKRRLALAALASGATAGLLMTSAILLAMLTGGDPAWNRVTAGDLAVGLAAGIEAGLAAASLPAFLAGSAMHALGRRFDAARRASAWAAAGAGAGAAAWAIVAAASWIKFGEPGLTSPDSVLLAAMLAGTAASLAFRAVAGPERRP